jgi:Fic family protein
MANATYIWEDENWPNFHWNGDALLTLHGNVRAKQGRLYQALATLGFDERLRAQADVLISETVNTALIEGDRLDLASVRSSVARRLGLESHGVNKEDRHAEGLVDVLHDAVANLEQPLERSRLDGWHAALFPTGYSGLKRIRIANFRDDAKGPMQVVSQRRGREVVHYEAPPATRVAKEMNAFLEWFNSPPKSLDPLLRVGLAHFWFVSIHPYEDGNGRLARAIGDRALSQCENNEQRFFSLSHQIQSNKKAYYDVLEKTQKGTGDLTGWLWWFLNTMEAALDAAMQQTSNAVWWGRLWQRHKNFAFNARHRKALGKLSDGPHEPVTPRLWRKLAGGSIETAQRDIRALEKAGIVRREGQGRGTKYYLVMDD